MKPTSLVAVAPCALANGLVSCRLKSIPVTAPRRLVLIGLLVAPFGLATVPFDWMASEFELILNRELLIDFFAPVVSAKALAHGLNATPLASVYGRWLERLWARESEGAEGLLVSELSVRIKRRIPQAILDGTWRLPS